MLKKSKTKFQSDDRLLMIGGKSKTSYTKGETYEITQQFS